MSKRVDTSHDTFTVHACKYEHKVTWIFEVDVPFLSTQYNFSKYVASNEPFVTTEIQLIQGDI